MLKWDKNFEEFQKRWKHILLIFVEIKEIKILCQYSLKDSFRTN